MYPARFEKYAERLYMGPQDHARLQKDPKYGTRMGEPWPTQVAHDGGIYAPEDIAERRYPAPSKEYYDFMDKNYPEFKNVEPLPAPGPDGKYPGKQLMPFLMRRAGLPQDAKFPAEKNGPSDYILNHPAIKQNARELGITPRMYLNPRVRFYYKMLKYDKEHGTVDNGIIAASDMATYASLQGIPIENSSGWNDILRAQYEDVKRALDVYNKQGRPEVEKQKKLEREIPGQIDEVANQQ